MESKKFVANYKCKCNGQNFCNCPKKDAANSLFLESIRDIAESLSQVMIICGIHPCKAKGAVDVIICWFIHYNEIYYQIDAIPKKRLCKEDLIHDLGRKCLMNRMEAQLSYSIIKRAFKSFYHGTDEGGIRNPLLEMQLVHTQECLWVHAAKRTAQIFASYEGLFISAQRNYESQIRCVYKHLYDRLNKRFKPAELRECECKGCIKRIFDNKLSIDINTEAEVGLLIDGCDASPKPINEPEQEDISVKLNTNNGINVSITALPGPNKCNCPKLICDFDDTYSKGYTSTDYSQGPYKCQWERMEEEPKSDPCIEIPEDHECPVDCIDVSNNICDDDCECNCSESCECESSLDTDDNEMIEENVQTNDDESKDESIIENSYNLIDVTERNPSPTYGGCRVIMHHPSIKTDQTLLNPPIPDIED